MNYPTIWQELFTATIQNWKALLTGNGHEVIIIDCLKFLVKDERIKLFAFTKMSNHPYFF